MKKLVTFFSAVIITTSAFAQIPNASFETWTNTSGYNTPTGWDNLNSMTSSMSVYTCTKGTPGAAGTSYLQLNSQTVSGMGVMPGVAVSGVLDMSDMMNIKPLSGFAYAMRPAQLTGSWQYMASGSDQGFVSILLTKWNTAMSKRDTVAYTKQNLTGMAMSWAAFSINLNYLKGENPDTAIIFLSASKVASPAAGSMLNVDNLAFAGTVPSSVANVSANSNFLSVFPNPATSSATVSYYSASGNEIQLFVSDMAGKSIVKLSSNTIVGNNNIPLNVSNFAKGIYMVKVIDGKNAQVQKLVIE